MTSTSAAASLMVPEAPDDAPLPPAGNVLAVTARPGQESAAASGRASRTPAGSGTAQLDGGTQIPWSWDMMVGGARSEGC